MFHLLGWFPPTHTPATLLHFIKATDSPFCHSAHSKLSSMQLWANCMWPVGKMQILPSHLLLGGSQLLLPPKQKLKFSQKSRRESFFICYKATSVWECNVCDCLLLSNYHKWQIQHRCYLIVVQKMQVTDTNCLVHLGNTVKQIRRTSDPISISVKHLKPVPESGVSPPPFPKLHRKHRSAQCGLSTQDCGKWGISQESASKVVITRIIENDAGIWDSVNMDCRFSCWIWQQVID